MRNLLPLLFILVCRLAAASDGSTSPTLAAGTRFRDPFLLDPSRNGPELAYIPAQEFLMGSAPESPGFKPDEIQHRVRVSAFSIGVFEITNAGFCEFLNERGNQIDSGIPWVLVDRPATCLILEVDDHFIPVEGAENRPVVTVSWNGANAYCDWLSGKTGERYRLPTEAEWECAARAGTTTIWPWGDRFDPTRLQWRGSPVAGATVPVGSYPPNPWGIHDMLGNAWEFVVDCVEEDFYRRCPTQDPVNYVAQCWTPGIRGGSFLDGPEFCRPGHRINTWWWGEYTGVSFRVVREETPNNWHRRRQRMRAPAGSPSP